MSDAPFALKFNFHNYVAVEVFADRLEDAEFFSGEYGLHQVEVLPADLPRVLLSVQRWHALDSIPPGYTTHTHKLVARWAYRLAVSNAAIEINVIANRLAIPMVHHMLLHPSLRYLAAQSGLLMLHAGAVASQGRSLILTGQGGAGKTTTTSLLLDAGGENWLPHADDYVFLRSGPKSLAYLTRSHLYLNLLDWVPGIRQRLTPSERRRLFFFGKLRAWSKDNVKWPVRLPIERLWPGRKAVLEATPVGLVLLNRTAASGLNLTALSPDDCLVDDLIGMNFREARHFLHLLVKSQSVANFQAWLASWQECERQLLQTRMAEIPIYLLELPRTHDSATAYRRALTGKLMDLVLKVG